MKKNLLFVIPSLAAGGGEKSLVNLLSQIDYKNYNVDLFLFNKSGLFLQSIPKEVNILNWEINYQIFVQKLNSSIKGFLDEGQFRLAYYRFVFSIKNRLIKNASVAEQYTWKYQSKFFDQLEKEYDAAIGYIEKSSIYFVVDKVKAKKKIGWIHTNYSDSGMDDQFDQPYFNKLNDIVTVSEECAHSLKVKFPQFKNKIRVIYNIVSPRMIYHLSYQDIPNEFVWKNDVLRIVTVARLSQEKGLDIAIKACNLLINRGHKVIWLVLGEGNERKKLEKLIQENNLKNQFKLLGVRENPYSYIKEADIYVQPSRYEGKSIALDEAKILHKPIVITNFETAADQIQHEVDGLIVEMNEEDLSLGIERLMKDAQLRERLVGNLSVKEFGTVQEINKLYKIL